MKKSTFLIFFLFISSVVGAQQNIQEIRRLIFIKSNEIRVSYGRPPFTSLDSLDRVAQYHSDQMVAKGFFSHIDPDGLNPFQRAQKLGVYPWKNYKSLLLGLAENIGQVPWAENVEGCGDTRSPEAIAECLVEGWKNSPDHYENIIGNHRNLGVGVQFNSEGVAFATQVFR